MARPKGIPHTAEWKKANSERMKKYWADKKNREAQSQKMKESWSDPKLCEKQSKMVKRKHAANPEKWAKSDETRKKISESLTGKPHPHTLEQNAKIAASLKGKKKSPETCARISEAKKGQEYRPRSKEHTANQAKTQTGVPKNHGESVSRGVKEYFNTPVGREQAKNHSKVMKQWHKDNPDASAEMIAAAQAANPKWRDTKPELQMAKILDDLKIRHRKQGRVGALGDPHRHHKWDFVIKNIKLLVEVDGCYWHGCREHASAERRRELEAHTSMQRARDRRARKVGWTVFRFWEHDMRDEAAVVRVIIGVVARAAKKVA